MSVTIKDIAKRCGVSASTVSLVLNNKGSISVQTRDRVLRVMKALDYDPYKNNPLAKRKTVKTIGLIMPFGEIPNPFYFRAITALKQAVIGRSFNVLMYSEPEIQQMIGENLPLARLNLQCDAFILFCPLRDWDRYLKVIAGWDVPVVLIRRTTQIPGIITVHDDDYQGCRLALEHLLAMGHERIGMVTYTHPHPKGATSDRGRAFADFLSRHDLGGHGAVTLHMDPGSPTPSLIRQARALMARSNPPTAFVCHNDETAAEFIKALNAIDLRVPQQVAVVGYGDDYIADKIIPTLTTVRIPVESMVDLGCRLISDRLKHNKWDQADIAMPNELIIRESCGCRAQPIPA